MSVNECQLKRAKSSLLFKVGGIRDFSLFRRDRSDRYSISRLFNRKSIHTTPFRNDKTRRCIRFPSRFFFGKLIMIGDSASSTRLGCF